MTDDVMLQCEGVSAAYGDFVALHDASIRVRRGEVVSIIGSNGAGKSTLLGAIAGLNKPKAGTITLDGQRIDGRAPNRIVESGLVLVPEGARVFGRMTVLENLVMGSYTAPARKKFKERLDLVYGLFPILAERAKQLSSNLSGGQRQMVAIGRALMSDPKIILFDEISLGLAPVVVKEIYQCIKAINGEGVSAVLVEQDVKRSLNSSNFSYVMLGGKTVLSGASATLALDDVQRAYFGLHEEG